MYIPYKGMKKGIVELADLVLITKADGDLIPAARRIQTEYSSALRLMSRASHSLWRPQVCYIHVSDISVVDRSLVFLHYIMRVLIKCGI